MKSSTSSAVQSRSQSNVSPSLSPLFVMVSLLVLTDFSLLTMQFVLLALVVRVLAAARAGALLQARAVDAVHAGGLLLAAPSMLSVLVNFSKLAPSSLLTLVDLFLQVRGRCCLHWWTCFSKLALSPLLALVDFSKLAPSLLALVDFSKLVRAVDAAALVGCSNYSSPRVAAALDVVDFAKLAPLMQLALVDISKLAPLCCCSRWRVSSRRWCRCCRSCWRARSSLAA